MFSYLNTCVYLSLFNLETIFMCIFVNAFISLSDDSLTFNHNYLTSAHNRDVKLVIAVQYPEQTGVKINVR